MVSFSPLEKPPCLGSTPSCQESPSPLGQAVCQPSRAGSRKPQGQEVIFPFSFETPPSQTPSLEYPKAADSEFKALELRDCGRHFG